VQSKSWVFFLNGTRELQINFRTEFGSSTVSCLSPITSRWCVASCLCCRGRWRSSWPPCRTVRRDTPRHCSSCRGNSLRPRYCNTSHTKRQLSHGAGPAAAIFPGAATTGRCHYPYSLSTVTIYSLKCYFVHEKQLLSLNITICCTAETFEILFSNLFRKVIFGHQWPLNSR